MNILVNGETRSRNDFIEAIINCAYRNKEGYLTAIIEVANEWDITPEVAAEIVKPCKAITDKIAEEAKTRNYMKRTTLPVFGEN